MKKLLFVLFALLAAVQFAFAAVNINTATESELDKLPGVGPAKAKAIVEDRKKNGPFKTTDDLKRVKGIGDKNFEAMRSEISIGDATAALKADAKLTAKPAADAKKDDAKKNTKK